MRITPPLETVQKITQRKVASLELRLRAQNAPDRRPLALARGLQKLKRAAYYANKARAPASGHLAAELRRVSARIQAHGFDAEVVSTLGSLIRVAATIEAETGEPVARRIATAVNWFTKPHAEGSGARIEIGKLRRQSICRVRIADNTGALEIIPLAEIGERR
jgi:hypothetical protein